ncbi:MAG: ankyrin repeat domain-containing protein [Pseudomonadota bacterium]
MASIYLSRDEEERYAALQLRSLDCARSGDSLQLERMIQAGMPVNLSDNRGNSLLMLAAYHDEEETVRMLLRHGADVDRRNDRGQTPLGGVAFKGNLNIARILIDGGASVDADNGGGKTPLMFAAMFGHRRMVEYLLSRGADPTSQTLFGISAQHLAEFTGALRSLGSFRT